MFSALYLCSVLEIQSSFHRLELCFQHYTSAQSIKYKAVFTSWNCVFSALYFSVLYRYSVLEIQGSLHQLELCFQHYTAAQSLRYKTVFTSWNCVFSIIVFDTSAQSLRYKAVITKLWSYAFSPLLILSCYCVSMQGSLHQLKLCFQCHAYTE